MAKAAPVPVDPSERFADAGARIVAVRARELFAHAEGVLDTEDVERVHAMRVATRRLRAVLEVFAPAFPRKRHRRVLGDVKALADALGERRDPDVALEALDAFVAAAPANVRRGARAYAARVAERQASGNERLAAALDEMRRSDLEGRLGRLVAGTDGERAA